MDEYYTFQKCNKSVNIGGVATTVAFEMQLKRGGVETIECKFIINGKEYNGLLIWTSPKARKEEYIFNGVRTKSVKKAIESILNK